MSDKSSPSVSIGHGWLASMDGRQKLALALISPAIAMLAYSFFQIQRVHQFQTELPARIEAASDIGHTLEREIAHLDTTKRILERGRERILLVKAADFGKVPSITEDELDAWRVTIAKIRINLKLDRGRLDQFVSHSFLKESAATLAHLLDQEDAMWVALQQFLEKQADVSSTAKDRETQFQVFTNKMLGLGQSIGSHESAILNSVDDLQNTERQTSREFQQLLTELRSHKRSFLVYSFLFAGAVAASLFCAAEIIQLRRKKPVPSPIITAKS